MTARGRTVTRVSCHALEVMGKRKRNHFLEALATAKAALSMFLILGSFFILFGVLSLDRMIRIGPLEDFRIGNVPIPSWQGASASNVSIFVLCLVGLVTVVVAIVMRYLHYRKDIEHLRSKGIYDVDEDGKMDMFKDKWLDDPYKRMQSNQMPATRL